SPVPPALSVRRLPADWRAPNAARGSASITSATTTTSISSVPVWPNSANGRIFVFCRRILPTPPNFQGSSDISEIGRDHLSSPLSLHDALPIFTGAAGFIGSQVARRLAGTKRCEVLGIDNLSDYYDVDLKRARLAELGKWEDFRFLQADFADAAKFAGLVGHFRDRKRPPLIPPLPTRRSSDLHRCRRLYRFAGCPPTGGHQTLRGARHR